MTTEPTPETDDLEDSLVAQDKQYPAVENSAFVKHCVEQLMAQCRAMEIQRNAARAEVVQLRAELADERAKKSYALIDVVQDITRLAVNLGEAIAALELIAAPRRPDGSYNRDRAACGSIAREALNAINK